LRHLRFAAAGSIFVKNAFLLPLPLVGSIEQKRLNTSAKCFNLHVAPCYAVKPVAQQELSSHFVKQRGSIVLEPVLELLFASSGTLFYRWVDSSCESV